MKKLEQVNAYLNKFDETILKLLKESSVETLKKTLPKASVNSDELTKQQDDIMNNYQYTPVSIMENSQLKKSDVVENNNSYRVFRSRQQIKTQTFEKFQPQQQSTVLNSPINQTVSPSHSQTSINIVERLKTIEQHYGNKIKILEEENSTLRKASQNDKLQVSQLQEQVLKLENELKDQQKMFQEVFQKQLNDQKQQMQFKLIMDQNDRYDNAKIVKLLTEANQFFEQNRDYPPQQIGDFLVEFCKLFKMLGKLLYFAFSDVIEKAQIIKDRGNEYNEQTKGIYGIIQIEKQKGIMELNGDNNKEILKNKTLPNYQSMARTMLRIIRFFNYLKIMFLDVDQNRNKKFSDICSDAYNEALAPYHTFMVRNAAKAAWLAAPNRSKVFECFVGPNQTDEVAYTAMKQFLNALEPIRLNFWDYYNTNKLTNLP